MPHAPERSSQGTLLVLSQVFVPDPASVGQHMADAAVEMARRGWRVVVLTANRGYDDPSMQYRAREKHDGVDIRRLPFSSFGKASIPVRLAAAAIFMTQCVLRGLFTRRLRAILVTTSPPMCSVAAVVIGLVRRVPIKYWVMDVNPDQMIELGRVSATALPARLFNLFNRLILAAAADVITLDRFMAERLNRKWFLDDKLHVIPPWPHEEHLEPVPHGSNPFREKHGLDGRFVIMYSGNHSIASPLTTILEAALSPGCDPRVMFVFVGGGLGKREVDRVIATSRPRNIVSLPYEPLAQIKYSLSAADVHLVSMGDSMVGVIHPCKIYGAMAVARPILFLGPDPCHASEIVKEHGIGWRVAHGDREGAVATIREIVASDPARLSAMGRTAHAVAHAGFGKALLCRSLCDVLERGTSRAHGTHTPTQQQAA
jgi:glycosyltransferase involved in cell wall biosynthesis